MRGGTLTIRGNLGSSSLSLSSSSARDSQRFATSFLISSRFPSSKNDNRLSLISCVPRLNGLGLLRCVLDRDFLRDLAGYDLDPFPDCCVLAAARCDGLEAELFHDYGLAEGLDRDDVGVPAYNAVSV